RHFFKHLRASVFLRHRYARFAVRFAENQGAFGAGEIRINPSVFIAERPQFRKAFLRFYVLVVIPTPMFVSIGAYDGVMPQTAFAEIQCFCFCTVWVWSTPLVKQFGCCPGLPNPFKGAGKFTCDADGLVILIYGKVE